jgi:hypothetical protein
VRIAALRIAAMQTPHAIAVDAEDQAASLAGSDPARLCSGKPASSSGRQAPLRRG